MSNKPFTLSVVIPVYNEEATILKTVNLVLIHPLVDEVIIVDDFSTDDTRNLLRTFVGDEKVTVLYHNSNKGKGAALRTGFAHTSKDLVIIQDADMEYDPSDYSNLIAPILCGRADVVFGSRFLGGPHRVLYFWHFVANKFLTVLSNIFTGLNLTDVEVCYKVFRKELLDRMDLICNRFGIEPELVAKAAMLDVRIYEVPVSYHGRTYDEGKKIGWRDGFSAVFWIVYFGVFTKIRLWLFATFASVEQGKASR